MRILLVDDNVGIARLYTHILSEAGHTVDVAFDGFEALAALHDEVDIVISDIDMPYMGGIELARRIRSEAWPVPICFCTASDPSDEIVAEAQRFGHVLEKDGKARAVLALLSSHDRARQSSPMAAASASSRHFTRTEIVLPTVLWLGSARVPIRGRTANVSIGGVLVRTSTSGPLGTAVELTVSAASSDAPFQLYGTIARHDYSEDGGVAVALTHWPTTWERFCLRLLSEAQATVRPKGSGRAADDKLRTA